MRLGRSLLLLALVLLAAIPATASAAKPATRAQAEEALEEAQQVLDGQGVRTGREVTPALARLAAGKPLLDSSDRREANQVLARPTDGSGPRDEQKYTTAEETPFCTTNFCIHYVASTDDAPSLTDADADSVPDYVELMAQEFEYVRSVENGDGTDQMGWRPPPSDYGRGGDDRTDVYIKQLGGRRIYGYSAPEGGYQSSYAYMVMDDDYAEFGGPNAPRDLLQVTAAHEYNHILQFGYNRLQDTWMLESSATWAEEQVYPAVSNYVGYLPRWAEAECTAAPLTASNPSGTRCDQKIYGSSVWNHWLTSRSDKSVIRRAWEAASIQSNPPFAPGAYETAIAQQSGTSFADEFNRLAASVAEWRAPGSGFPDAGSYPDVGRSGALVTDGPARSETLDHTTFRFIGVTPDSSKSQVRLHADLPSGTKGAIALVGRTGPDPAAGTVATKLQQLPSGGSGDVTLDNPGAYGRITAVLVNSDVSNNGYDYGARDWAWRRDDQTFSNVAVAGSPAPGAAGGGGAPGTASPSPATVAPLTGVPGVTAPALASRLALKSAQRLSGVLARGVSFRLRCNRACRVKGRLRLAGPGIRGLKRNQTIGTVSTRLSKAGVKTIRIKLTRKARAALRGKRRVKVKLSLGVTPSSGKPKTITRTLTLRR